ncbi:nucleotidyltransferase domain-containing protein [Quadrisphaera oryzae]|uniref:nucleotidyltransferase domain-containing protein n=1 Tax=Quadrisphaera TaxID=317661 RepID=UPI001C95C099|nr:hypothetical protein [Quadrisphaera sp. RL12-1S]
MLSHDDVVRWYGPWRRRTPDDAAALLSGYPGAWWIAGGWAVEAFTGAPRPHGDLDLSIPVADTPLLHEHLHGRLDVWAAFDGALRPLLTPRQVLPAGCSNLWLRADGASPWVYDVLLMTADGADWVYKRDARVRRPLAELVWERDGVRYLRPEVQLLHKAAALRDVDRVDAEAALPLLDAPARSWLRSALSTAHPQHPWLERL